MTDERLARIGAALRELGADWAVLTSADAVAYATGHASQIDAGASPFSGGPAVALVSRDGTAGIVLADGADAAARATVTERYDAYGRDQSDAPTAAFAAAVARLAAVLGAGGRWAIERATHTAAIGAVLGGVSVDITPALRRARMTKTPDELVALRRAAAVTAAGQRAFVASLRAGRTELDLFADIRRAMEAEAGARLAIAGDLVCGAERTAAIGGLPGPRRLVVGDAVIADLAPRVDGMWADSCATVVIGRPSEGQARLFAAARAALDHALSVMRPGLPVAALHAAVRGVVRAHGLDYPHHSGHSIGTAVHEHPRVCAAATETLAADMVLMIEPGAYVPGLGGARTEWMVHVTPTGCEPVEPFAHVLSVS